MDIRPIRTEADYEAVLKLMFALGGAAPGTGECDRPDALTTLGEVNK